MPLAQQQHQALTLPQLPLPLSKRHRLLLGSKTGAGWHITACCALRLLQRSHALPQAPQSGADGSFLVRQICQTPLALARKQHQLLGGARLSVGVSRSWAMSCSSEGVDADAAELESSQGYTPRQMAAVRQRDGAIAQNHEAHIK